MKVKIVRQFTAIFRDRSGKSTRYVGRPGMIMDMPDGAPWVRDGYAIVIPDNVRGLETAIRKPTEPRVKHGA